MVASLQKCVKVGIVAAWDGALGVSMKTHCWKVRSKVIHYYCTLASSPRPSFFNLLWEGLVRQITGSDVVQTVHGLHLAIKTPPTNTHKIIEQMGGFVVGCGCC